MSITLASAATMSINGSPVESDANASLYYMEFSFPSSVRLFYRFGTTVGSVFIPGSQLPAFIVTLNLVTGVWSSSNGMDGTLTGSPLTTLQNDFLAVANDHESFVVTNSVIAGTAVPWTSSIY